jgi:hypothetical protein
MRRLTIALALLLAAPAAGRAQDFGVMEPARTTTAGALLFTANPMLIAGEGAADNVFGISVLAGYGFTEHVDVEFGAAIYEGVSFVGGRAKLWVVQDEAIDLSASAGLHLGRSDTVDTTGIDLTFIGSTRLTPRVTFFGALDFAFDSADEIEHTFKTVHLVPGLVYELRDGVELLLEAGVGVNDDSAHYLSGGLTYYLR